MKFLFRVACLLSFPFFWCCPSDVSAQKIITTDVLVVGGGTGGIAAGIQSARMGVKTVIVEQTYCLGGMLTAAGVSCTDGNDLLPGGMWQEFRQALYKHYGRKDLATGWVSETCFEPHVGDSIFKAWAAKEKNLTVIYDWYFDKSLKQADKITGVIFKNKKGERRTVKSKITIDATELGDVFADAGATYDLGTEDSLYSKEKMAPGKTNIIQDITWTAILKDYGVGADKTIAKPVTYDPKEYYCCCTSAPCKDRPYNVDAQKMLDYGKLPNDKYMINWPAHGNDYYINIVEKKPLEREREYIKIKKHTLGFIYFIQKELGFKNLGLADDELDNGMALIPYNREGRRVRGVVRFNINHILDSYNQPAQLYRTGIAVGDYPVDHHHGQNPNTPKIDFPSIPSFNIPLGALIPAKIDGLIVCEKGISVSNIVNGATRLQPVVLLTGQAAGALAALSIQDKQQARHANVREVQQILLDAGCYLMPYVDIKPGDPYWQTIQRVGATGILKGTGKPEGWENKTFFYPDSTITAAELSDNILKLIGKSTNEKDTSKITVQSLSRFISFLRKCIISEPGRTTDNSDPGFKNIIDAEIFSHFKLTDFNETRSLKRKEVAVLLEGILGIFTGIRINWEGNYIYSKMN